MPLYEYICEEDGTVLELMRPMANADDPVPDPEHKGRTFKRQLSTFMSRSEAPSGSGMPVGGCCPCGKQRGACGSN